MRDETIDCHPGSGDHVGAAILALIFWPMAIAPWFAPNPVAVLLVLGCSVVFGTPPLLLIVWNVRSRRGANATGLSWRDGLGRAHAAPWTSVVGLRSRVFAGDPGYVVELSDGRVVRWSARWPRGEALREYVANRLDRGAFRNPGDRIDEAPVRVTFPAWPRRIGAAFGLAIASGGLLFCGWCATGLVEMIRRGGDVGPALYMLAILVLPMTSGALFVAPAMWRQRRAHSRDVLVLDPRGLTVTGGEVELRASWNDVTAVAPFPSLGDSALRVVTMAGTFVVPHDPIFLVRAQLRARIPPSVRDVWERPDDDADRAATLPDGSRRHGFDLFGLCAPWRLDAVAMTLIGFPTITVLAMRPDDQPIALPAAHFATLATLCALWVLLHRGARALLGVTVSPTYCVWSGPWRRRRFAWSEVAAVGFPADAYSRLSLRLADGTRLWCLPSLLAGGNALVASFREHLATVPRSETP